MQHLPYNRLPVMFDSDNGKFKPWSEDEFDHHMVLPSNVAAINSYCKWLQKRKEVFEVRLGYQCLLVKSTIDPKNVPAEE